MRFLVRLSNERKYVPTDRHRLTSLAYEAVRLLGGDIGNLRISSFAVELDLLIDSKGNLDRAIRALENKIGSLVTIREIDLETAPMESAEAVKLGLALFNEERYWESHEALEAAWRRSSGSEKEILQGIILLAVALVHLQKSEQDITLSVMKRAYEKLEKYHNEHFGINLSALKEKVMAMLSSSRPAFFKIDARN
jgi:predicted metal-dependent hydrolase